MKKGVLLVNLGSPDSFQVKDVRRYLREFLSDPRVLDVWWVRNIILNLFILPRRPAKSAEAYQKIWTDKGSPLIVITENLCKKVQSQTGLHVEIAMRYGNPSIQAGLKNLKKRGCRDILVIPLYPQYAMSTTETVIEKCLEVQKKYYPELKLQFEPPFYNHPDFIRILSQSIKNQLPESYDMLLFSYHGIPERHIYKTDKTGQCQIGNCCLEKGLEAHQRCYRHQCFETTELVCNAAHLDTEKVKLTFQSRLGSDPWLKPFTDETLESLAKKGVKNIAVAAPAFVADCLETLEEIAMEGKHIFMENGGESFTYISCLNDDDVWAEWLAKRIQAFENNEKPQPDS